MINIKINQSREIIEKSLDKYKPVNVLLLFSGGHDSLCSTHLAASYLTSKNIPFTVYHGNTGIGIKETREYVYKVVKDNGWNFFEGHPKKNETYRDIVKKWGFPGPTAQSHSMMYIRLKERALKKYITHSLKSKPYARENVMLITGIRRSESRIRMGYKVDTKKEDSRVWTSTIFYWDEKDIRDYMLCNNLPRNPVKDKICISGECLCGAFAKREEWVEIKESFPEVAKEIENLHQLAIENGHPWDWASGA